MNGLGMLFFDLFDGYVKMAESFIHKSIEDAIHFVTEPHTVDILGATMKSNLNYIYGSGITDAFNFDGKPMRSGTSKLTTDFKSTLTKMCFNIGNRTSQQFCRTKKNEGLCKGKILADYCFINFKADSGLLSNNR